MRSWWEVLQATCSRRGDIGESRRMLQEGLYFGTGNHWASHLRESFFHIEGMGCVVHPPNALIILQGGSSAGKVFCTMCETTMLPTELFHSQ